jgi:hypothetical protein
MFAMVPRGRISPFRPTSCGSQLSNVITGYNTDIEHEGVTYHVQTEDKGLTKPIILSLVYNGGTILASKRAPYDDLVSSGFDEKELEERLNRQHRLICAAIKAGRIDELKKLNSKNGKKKTAAQVVTVNGNTDADLAFEVETDYAVPHPDSGELMFPIPKPETGSLADLDMIMAAAETVVEPIGIVGEEIVPASAVVAIESELAGSERPANNRLEVELLGDKKLKGGESREIAVMVCRGTSRKIVPHAEVMIKVIGSSFRPLIFHSWTDDNGLAQMTIDIPSFKKGRAALLVRIMSDGEETELRRPISHG